MIQADFELRTDNPFSIGFISTFGDTEIYLERESARIIESPNDRIYEIEEGDTLTSIAGRAYGNSKLWWLIYDANPNVLFHPFILPVGENILIPDFNTFIANN